jgi:hypothetical protein
VAVMVTVGVVSFSKNAANSGNSGYAKTNPAPNVRLVSDAEKNAPHYSTGQTPLPYDKTIAF